MQITVPDGLGAFLQTQFGGTLKSPPLPSAGNRHGRRSDSSFSIWLNKQIPGEAVVEAVVSYYKNLGFTIFDCGNLCFEVRLADGQKLFVSLSNYTGEGQSCRILGSVDM